MTTVILMRLFVGYMTARNTDLLPLTSGMEKNMIIMENKVYRRVIKIGGNRNYEKI